jgi:hypothetical protein
MPTKTLDILMDGLKLKDFFLEKGLIEVSLKDINEIPNAFSMKISDDASGFEYSTTANDAILLSCIFNKYSDNQINEIVSLLSLYENLFFTKERYLTKIDTYQNNLRIDNGWLLIYASVKNNSKRIHIDFNKYSTFFQNISLKENNFEESIRSLKNMFKKAVNAYYNQNNVEVNIKNIKRIINESCQDYDYRINSKGLYNINYFNLTKDNIIKSFINYKIINQNYENKCVEFLNKNKLLISKSKNEDDLSDNLHNTKFGLKYIFKRTNYKIPEIMLKSVFKEDDISYIISIISLLSFINEINNDYSKNETINMLVDKFSYDSKNATCSHNTIIFNQIGNFRFNIGRTIEIYYFNDSSYSRKSNGSIVIADIRYQSSFKVVYDKLLKDFIKKISISQELKPKNLKFNNILLEHMQNY